jgi:hypothetical protein
MAGLATPRGYLPRWFGNIRPETATLAFTFVLGAVAFVVVFPILLLVINSFQVGIIGQPTTWGLENWRTALAERGVRLRHLGDRRLPHRANQLAGQELA